MAWCSERASSLLAAEIILRARWKWPRRKLSSSSGPMTSTGRRGALMVSKRDLEQAAAFACGTSNKTAENCSSSMASPASADGRHVSPPAGMQTDSADARANCSSPPINKIFNGPLCNRFPCGLQWLKIQRSASLQASSTQLCVALFVRIRSASRSSIVKSRFRHTNSCFNFSSAPARLSCLPEIMPSVFIKTYGCQMNERDSEAVAAQLVAKGYSLAKSEATADVVLLNTCSVRDLAEQKAIDKMKNLVGTARSETAPTRLLGFMGCMAQSRGQELIDKLPDVDLVLGTQKFHRAAEYLDEILAGKREKIVDVDAEEKKRGDHPRTSAQRQRQDIRHPRSSASCKAATSIAPFASCPTRAARNAAAPFPTSSPNAANWSRAA